MQETETAYWGPAARNIDTVLILPNHFLQSYAHSFSIAIECYYETSPHYISGCHVHRAMAGWGHPGRAAVSSSLCLHTQSLGQLEYIGQAQNPCRVWNKVTCRNTKGNLGPNSPCLWCMFASMNCCNCPAHDEPEYTSFLLIWASGSAANWVSLHLLTVSFYRTVLQNPISWADTTPARMQLGKAVRPCGCASLCVCMCMHTHACVHACTY